MRSAEPVQAPPPAHPAHPGPLRTSHLSLHRRARAAIMTPKHHQRRRCCSCRRRRQSRSRSRRPGCHGRSRYGLIWPRAGLEGAREATFHDSSRTHRTPHSPTPSPITGNPSLRRPTTARQHPRARRDRLRTVSAGQNRDLRPPPHTSFTHPPTLPSPHLSTLTGSRGPGRPRPAQATAADRLDGAFAGSAGHAAVRRQRRAQRKRAGWPRARGVVSHQATAFPDL